MLKCFSYRHFQNKSVCLIFSVVEHFKEIETDDVSAELNAQKRMKLKSLFTFWLTHSIMLILN